MLLPSPHFGVTGHLPCASFTSFTCCFRMNELICAGGTETTGWLSGASSLDGKPKACAPLDVASWSLGRSKPCKKHVQDMAKPCSGLCWHPNLCPNRAPSHTDETSCTETLLDPRRVRIPGPESPRPGQKPRTPGAESLVFSHGKHRSGKQAGVNVHEWI